MKTCVLFDLDGTLADVSHRVVHVTSPKKDWQRFFDASIHDMPIFATSQLFFALQEAGHNVLIVTARPEDYRMLTEAWLHRWNLIPNALYMRKHGDFRQDAVIKAELLAQLREDGWQPMMVIDDRQQVVDMWKEQGLPVFQYGGTQPCGPKVPVAGKDLLHIMVGPTGAGKSTYLMNKYWNDILALNYVLVSSDSIRQELCGDFRDQSKNDLVFDLLHERVALRMKYGLFTVVDATNLYRKDRLAVANLCPRDAKVTYIVIDRPLEEKLKTAGWRAEVPGLIEKHDQRFKSQLKDILAGDNLPNVTVLDKRSYR